MKRINFITRINTLSPFFCIFFLCGAVSAQGIKTGTVSGQLMLKAGGPMSGGQVFFFNDASGPPPSWVKYWRVPDYTTQIDEGGKFSIELPAGKYYLGAIKRISGERIGPPADGDYFFASADEKGSPKPYVVKNGEKIELGVVSEAVPFQKRAVIPGAEITAIEGAVFNTEGKTVEGALVSAQLTPLNTGRHPLFTSERTGKDGHYILKVHDGGNYYLRVRSMHDKGPPAAGEMIGAYGGKEPRTVVIKKGQIIRGIDITVVQFIGRGAEKEQSPPEQRDQLRQQLSN
jgi:hypothetical protein